MARSLVWIEGVDFDETLVDSQKLSVIRGASRALEEMAGVALCHFERKFGVEHVRRVTAGASQAGLIVERAAWDAEPVLGDLLTRLRAQGEDPRTVEPVAKDPEARLEECAPFAHLKFHGFVEAIEEDKDDKIGEAFERARARVRVAQSRDPGARAVFRPAAGVADRPCEFDRVRPAELIVEGPAATREGLSSPYSVSRASAARWHFGRALRQRIYDGARDQLGGRYAFADDFHEITATPRPSPSPRDAKPPKSAARKIAVFAADGDKFTKLRADLVDAVGHEAGLMALTGALETFTKQLIEQLVKDLVAMDAEEDCKHAAAAVFYEGEDCARSTSARRKVEKLLRFETLTLGGEDIVFVAPSWLGWWLALRFFAITANWRITRADLERAAAACSRAVPADLDELKFRMRFSAGLIFCSRKTPIRAAKSLADELCHAAKQAGGGLEVEVLESVEPPFDGLSGLRGRLLGASWPEAGAKGALTLPRERVLETYKNLHQLWIKEAFPASQAHRALRAARDSGDLSGTAADTAAEATLDEYFQGAGDERHKPLLQPLPPSQAAGKFGLNLHFALQMRDYVKAAGVWTDRAAGLEARP
jgi:hypothetical protein